MNTSSGQRKAAASSWRRQWGCRARGGSLALGLILAGILAWAGGAAIAAPALWKLTGPRATVYLFGTVHVLKPGLAWRDPKIDAALNSADALWLEVPDADDTDVMQPLILKYGVDRTTTLSSTLDAPTRTRLAAVMGRLAFPPAMLEPLRPWLAGVTLEALPMMKAGYDPANGVESIIKAQVVASGRPVRGFETAEAQIRYLADLTPAVQTAFLRASIDDAEKADTDLDRLVAAWAAGDETTIETILNSEMRDQYPDLYKLLITDRNARFAGRIAELLKGEGVQFVAVGAGHLVGRDSVQADLAQMGITATRQ